MSQETPGIGAICARWWSAAIASDTGTARKTRAQLRRAATPIDALGVAAVHDLNRALIEAGHNLRKQNDGPDRLALIAIVLARMSDGHGAPMARRLGAGDPPALSPLRFNALIRTKAPRALIRPMVRAVQIVRGGADLPRLSRDIYWWNDAVRSEWCFDYFGASDAKPESINKEADT